MGEMFQATVSGAIEALEAGKQCRVVRLFEEWDKPDRAAAWKARLGMSDLPADVFARP